MSDININLLITERCNFECDHCMFVSGPKRSSAYLTPEVWIWLGDHIEELHEAGHHVNINLVGGEPTLDMVEFEWRFQMTTDLCRDTGASWEMSTNGWWLESREMTEKFVRIVGPFLEECCPVRISQSDYHTPFRSDQVNRLFEMMLHRNPHGFSLLDIADEDLWDGQHLHEGCGGEVEWDEDQCGDVCQECGEVDPDRPYGISYYDQEALRSIYVDNQTSSGYGGNGGPGKISATGRATMWGYQEPTCYPYDEDDPETIWLTIDAKGHMRDFCCNGGSTVRLGPAVNRPLSEWVDIAKGFLKRVKRNNITCRDCPAFSREERKTLLCTTQKS